MSGVVFFQQLLVRFLSLDATEIRWDVEPTIDLVSNVGFEVQRSETQAGPFEPVSPVLTNLFTYRDTYEGYTSSKFRIIFYRVKAFKLDDPSKFEYSPTDYVHENPFDDTDTPYVDPVVDVIRRNDLLLQHDRYRIGKPCIIYQKRSTGLRCSCFDPITQRVTQSKCAICLGTGRVEGYYAGIDDIYVAFTSMPKQRMIQQFGDTEPGDTSCWMSNFPIVKPEDIIVNKLTNEHYLVKRVRTSVHLVLSKQTIMVRKLNFDDIKTRLPFEMGKFRM